MKRKAKRRRKMKRRRRRRRRRRRWRRLPNLVMATAKKAGAGYFRPAPPTSPTPSKNKRITESVAKERQRESLRLQLIYFSNCQHFSFISIAHFLISSENPRRIPGESQENPFLLLGNKLPMFNGDPTRLIPVISQSKNHRES